ncbi:hypothetical protein B0H63DRAFT_521382 [Podospora didyma]|uniref:Uncharacterized protein n=1 Tax=Podospora didyma TaxID=330526 RepID=A0AAE0U1P5_9PEZI|nr:hypothetical protein B0H63DRAFT_521382 [Podospora didyma]
MASNQKALATFLVHAVIAGLAATAPVKPQEPGDLYGDDITLGHLNLCLIIRQGRSVSPLTVPPQAGNALGNLDRAPVYLAAVFEYLATEILELAIGNDNQAIN